MPGPVEKRIINGIVHRQCLDCGEWTPYNPKLQRCPICQPIFISKYNKEKRKGGKYKHPKPESKKSTVKELKGELPVSQLYKSCIPEEIDAMKRCDVQALLRINKPPRS